ncbi:hypothetical protein NSQ62_07560 [Solibacillus sp. FSL H8-0523]|uniref:hypothetical protein n=1 Tax=Solibacillus sp. FSL H8-0523 TaxID=2954511 RepID=UPI003100E08F
MKKILQIVLTFGTAWLIYYGVEQYRLKEMSEILQEIEVVSPERFNKLSIIQYPEQQNYVSFDYDEVQATFRALKKLEVKEAKRLKESENYTKIRLLEDGSHQFVEYYFYDNDSIQFVEEGLVAFRSVTYQVDEAELHTVLDSLLAGKTFD